MDIPALERELCRLPLAQYAFFPTDALVFSSRVRAVCEQECPRYGKTWSCPPAVGDLQVCIDRCRSYPQGLLIVSLGETKDASDFEKALKTRPTHEALTRQVAELLKKQGAAPFVLSAQSCDLCESCTCPDAPCRHPEQMFPCVESHGIVVPALAEKSGIDLSYGNNVIAWVSLLLFF